MSNLKLLVLSILLFAGIFLNSLVIELSLGTGIRHHNKNYDLDDPPSDPEVPSIGVFYKDGSLLKTDLRFYLNDYHKEKESFFLGASYSLENVSAKHKNHEILLGEKLSNRNLNLYFGYGKILFNKYPNSYIFGYMGLSLNSYNGETKLDKSYIAEYSFKDTKACRFAIGNNIFFSSKKIFFANFLFTYDIGSVERGDIKIFYDSEYIGTMEPTGDQILPDQSFSLSINIGYSFTFTKEQSWLINQQLFL